MIAMEIYDVIKAQIMAGLERKGVHAEDVMIVSGQDDGNTVRFHYQIWQYGQPANSVCYGEFNRMKGGVTLL